MPFISRAEGVRDGQTDSPQGWGAKGGERFWSWSAGDCYPAWGFAWCLQPLHLRLPMGTRGPQMCRTTHGAILGAG